MQTFVNYITLSTPEKYTGTKKIDKVYILSNQHLNVSLNFTYILVARKKKSVSWKSFFY